MDILEQTFKRPDMTQCTEPLRSDIERDVFAALRRQAFDQAAARGDDYRTMSRRDQRAADFERAQFHASRIESGKKLYNREAPSLHAPSSSGQRVLRPAIRTLGGAASFHGQIHFGMGIPQRHLRHRT